MGTCGPRYCNNTAYFHLHELKSIIRRLEVSWADFKQFPLPSKPGRIWKHEWKKHGSCGMTIKPLNTVFKYFKYALDLLKKYQLCNIFGNANIYPNNSYPILDYWNAIKNVIKKDPRIDCVEDRVCNILIFLFYKYIY